jgi:hypothetical protein
MRQRQNDCGSFDERRPDYGSASLTGMLAALSLTGVSTSGASVEKHPGRHRSWNLLIFPVGVLGIAPTNSTQRGYL